MCIYTSNYFDGESKLELLEEKHQYHLKEATY